MDQLNTQFQKHLCFSFLIKYDWKFTPHGEIFFTMRCTNTPNSVKVDFYTSKCKKKVKFNRKIVSLVGESFYTKGCKSVKVNFYTLWCNGQHSKEYPTFKIRSEVFSRHPHFPHKRRNILGKRWNPLAKTNGCGWLFVVWRHPRSPFGLPADDHPHSPKSHQQN